MKTVDDELATALERARTEQGTSSLSRRSPRGGGGRHARCASLLSQPTHDPLLCGALYAFPRLCIGPPSHCATPALTVCGHSSWIGQSPTSYNGNDTLSNYSRYTMSAIETSALREA